MSAEPDMATSEPGTSEQHKQLTLDDVRANLEALNQLGSFKKPYNASDRSAFKSRALPPKFGNNAPTPLTLNDVRANMEVLRQMSSVKKRVERPQSNLKIPRRILNVETSVKRYNNAVSKVNTRQTLVEHPRPTVKKALDFITINKKKITNIPRPTHQPQKDEVFKQPMNLQPKKTYARNMLRISGVVDLPETPQSRNPTRKSKDKENIPEATKRSIISNIPKKSETVAFLVKDESIRRLSISSTANSEMSFLRTEKELCQNESIVLKASTPFKKYREVCHEITNMSNNFESPFITERENFVNLDQRSIRNNNLSCCKLDLSFVEKEIVSNNDLLSLRNDLSAGLENIKNMQQAFETLLNRIDNYLINNKNMKAITNDENENDIIEKMTKFHIQYSQSKNAKSVPHETQHIASPRIPRSGNLTRRILYKSMPEDLNSLEQEKAAVAPIKPLENHKRALSMYMEMKQDINFLQTPFKNTKKLSVSSTPRLTSLNLMAQLEKLYNEK